MKILLLSLTLLLFPFGPARAQNDVELRVLSYNILHGATLKGDFNMDTIANRFLAHDADLIGMQEVDRLTNRAKKMDLVTELGFRTKMAPLFGRAMYYDSGEYGEGILSRYSFVSTRNHPLPASPSKEPRAALEALVRLPSGDTLAFVGTHLDHTQEEERIRQAERLVEIYTDFPYPVILCGDLNATPDSETMQILFKIFKPCYGNNPAPTIPSSGPKSKIDYILLDKNHKWAVDEVEVICDQVVSDHCGYFAKVRLLKN